MFVNIKTFFLYDSVATQTMNLIYNIEDSKASDECKQSHCYCSDELSEDGAVCYSVDSRINEYSSQYSAKQTAHAVHRYSTHRVVNLAHLIYKGNRETHHNAHHCTNKGSGTDAYTVASSRDAYQTSQHTVAQH